jgi:hypothetical protein
MNCKQTCFSTNAQCRTALKTSQFVSKRNVTVKGAKQAKHTVKERVYDREKTIFGKWKADTPQSLQQMIKEDMQFWKAAKFVKSDEDVSAQL